VPLPAGAWRRLEVPVPADTGAALVLRLGVSETFRPIAKDDRRELGIEVGADPFLRAAP
jgi:hypothetical protein